MTDDNKYDNEHFDAAAHLGPEAVPELARMGPGRLASYLRENGLVRRMTTRRADDGEGAASVAVGHGFPDRPPLTPRRPESLPTASPARARGTDRRWVFGAVLVSAALWVVWAVVLLWSIFSH